MSIKPAALIPSRVVENQKQEEKAHEDWVNSQFSFWDGSHNELKNMVKERLNDERSFKHIETRYIEISNDSIRDDYNKMLKDAGISNRVEIGDLFIIMEFSAKNGFNATIKSMAYGIASYANNTISLVGIE